MSSRSMSALPPSALEASPLLRRLLYVDALFSGAAGAALALGADAIAGPLGLPRDLLFYAGLVCLPWAAALVWLASRVAVRRTVVWAVIAGNAVWAVDSIALLLSGWVAPTALGTAFVVGQAAVVAAFAELQYLGLRRSPRLD